MAVTLFDPQTGSPVTLEDNDAIEAVRTGRLGFEAGAAPTMVGPDGDVVSSPLEHVQEMFGRGYRLESNQERADRETRKQLGGAGGQLAAGGLGALSAVSLGASDALIGSVNPKVRDTLAKTYEANPGTRIAGELAGTAAAIASGVGAPSALGKLAAGARGATTARLGGGLGARLAGRVAGGAAEGSLYGLGRFISEEGLSQNPELTAERLFSYVGPAGGLGALFGAGGWAGAETWRKGKQLFSKLGGRGLQKTLDETANKIAVRQWASPKLIRDQGLNQDEIQKIGDYAWRRGLRRAGDDELKAFARAEADEAIQGQTIGNLLDQTDRVAKFNMPRLTARLQQEVVDAMGGDPTLRRAQRELQSYIKAYQDYGPAGTRQGVGTFRRLWELRSNLSRDMIPPGDPLYAADKHLRKFHKIFTEELFGQAEAAPGVHGKLLRAASRRWRNAHVLKEAAKGAVERPGLHSADRIVGEVAGLASAAAWGPLALGAGLAGAGASYSARRWGGGILGSALKKAASSKGLSRMKSGLHKFVRAGIDSSPVWGGAFRAQLERAVADGPDSTLATHVQLAQSDPNYLVALGMEDDAPFSDDFAKRLDQLDEVGGAVDEAEAIEDDELNRWLGGATGRPRGLPEMPEISVEELEQQAKILKQMKADPTMAASFAPDLPEAPRLSAIATMVGARAAQFLESQIPRPPNPNPIKAFDVGWTPDPIQLQTWARIVDTVKNPQRVLEDVRHGSLSAEQVRTMENVYPQLLLEYRRKMLERLSQYDKPLTFQQRTSAEKLLGIPPDQTLFALIQNMYTAQDQAAEPGGGGGADGRQKVSVAENAETQAQRIEARG